jgi:serine/threonine protein kinase/Tfp pilus assembly protein PilF
MGEVYEAEDLELHERVALKTVRPEVAADSRAIDRFKREIQLARRVTHPNVCRIFDLGHHSLATDREITFLTMELLAGESLAGRLRTKGRMTTQEAFPLVAQMAAALAAAHEAGIVHRDFKPGNVMLVPVKGNEAEFRAVVTDFGLARRTAAEESFVASLSVAGEVMGTPAYMAPEQVEGKEITSAADLYALGAVMFEMVTGRLPFGGDTPFAVAVKRLTEPAPSPRTLVPDLDPRWEAAILRCLAREPEERFEAASEAVAALRAEAPVTLPSVLARRRRKTRAVLLIACAAVLAVLAIVGGSRIWHDRQLVESRQALEPPRPITPIQPRRSVAVLGFKNLSGNPKAAWLSSALSDQLSSELAIGEKLRTIPGENVALMRMSLSLPEADSYSKETLSRIRANLGADLVVLGSFLSVKSGAIGQIRLDVRLQDASAGETIALVRATGTEDRLIEMVSNAGAALREKLGVTAATASQSGLARASLPGNPEAARLLAEGLSKVRLFDAPAAKDLLERAVKADPKHPLLHAVLASAWSAMGYDGKSKEEAKNALDLASNVPAEQRLLIEGGYHEAFRDWPKAVETYRKLFLLYPDNPDYGLRLARALTSGGNVKEALSTTGMLRKLPSPIGEDPRIDLADAAAYASSSDFSNQLKLAMEAENKGSRLGARLIVANARSSQGLALWSLGIPKKARAAFEAAQRIYAAVGDRRAVADSLNNIANLLADEGDGDGSRLMYEAALEVYREIGDRGGVAQILNNTGLLLWEKGRLTEAKTRFKDAHEIYEETGDKANAANALDNAANIFWQQGDSERARPMYEKALAVRREIGNLAGVVTSLNNLGNLLLEQGAMAEARKLLDEALVLASKVGDQRGVAITRYNLGEVLKAAGELTSARQQHEQSLAISSNLGQKRMIAESQLAVGDLALREGRLAEATDLARKAAGEFNEEKAADREASALALLARGLLAQGRVAESLKAIEAAEGLAARAENAVVRLTVRTTSARIRAASGKPTEALRMLQRVVTEATNTHLIIHALEGHLAQGEVEMNINPSRGRTRLLALQQDAEARGFGLIARQAAAAAR